MSEFYVGEIRMTAGLVSGQPPEGWLLCDGSLLQINSYQMLYALIGTRYGGDGVQTFGLPDYRSRIPIGFGQAAAPLTTNYPMGSKGGLETVPITSANLPAHTHQWYASKKAATQTTATGNLFGDVAFSAGPPIHGGLYEDTTVTGFNWYNTAPTVIGSTGNAGATHENRMPSAAIYFIIATTGLFPVQS